MSKSAVRIFDEAEEVSNSKSLYWLGEERLSAVNDVIECNNQTSSVIGLFPSPSAQITGLQSSAKILSILKSCFCHADAFVEALRCTIDISTAFMSYLAKGNLLRQKNTKTEDGGLCKAVPGFCFWTLVPEKPQALVVEDALLDAR